VKVRIWGARGSVPAPGPETTRYGGNTSCLEVTLSDGTMLILDAGTGIRTLGLQRVEKGAHIQILLTHLHLDHIQGLLFFQPSFDPDNDLTIWGPAAPDASLENRIGRYISAPLSPVEVRELPCNVSFRDSPATEWEIGPARILAASVTHRGPTLGYRITDGDTSLCYIPDHEPALGGAVEELESEWITGFELAQGADLLVHDCQYRDEEYPNHLGWGHSAVSDSLRFARRVDARKVLLFHHDPLHSDDMLDQLAVFAGESWRELGRDPAELTFAQEGAELEVGAPDESLTPRPG
jgi:phosphoribosyl 1,2-cyclic phosphodiesterase